MMKVLLNVLLSFRCILDKSKLNEFSAFACFHIHTQTPFQTDINLKDFGLWLSSFFSVLPTSWALVFIKPWLNEDTMLRTQSSNACVTAMLPSLATHETVWQTQNLCPGHMKMFLKRLGNNVCDRSQSNNVALFSHAGSGHKSVGTHRVLV